jgi:hypothetical protein
LAPKIASITGRIAFIIDESGSVVDANAQEIARTALQWRPTASLSKISRTRWPLSG